MTAAKSASVALVASGLSLGVEIAVWKRDCDRGIDCAAGPSASGVVKMVFALALVVLAGVILARLLLRRRPMKVALAPTTLVLGAAATLAAATPVGASWDDGCNVHVATVPVIGAPVMWVTSPETARLSYEDISTLRACAIG